MEPNEQLSNHPQKENQYVLIDKSKKYYPVGFIEKKDVILSRIFLVIYCLTIGLATYFGLQLKNILFFVLPTIICIILYFLFLVTRVKKNEQCYFEFMNDLNFEKLEQSILEILNDEKVHPETKNYYLMRLVMFSPCYSKEKYLEYGNQVKIPTNKTYRINYDLLAFSNNLSLEELNQLYEFLSQKYKKNKRIYKLIQQEYKIQKAAMLGTSEVSMEQLLQGLGKSNYNLAIQSYFLAFYYAHAHDKEKFQKHYDEFVSKYAILNGLKEKLDDLKDKLEKETL